MYGTDTGIYVSDRRPRATDTKPKKVLDVNSVTQIDVLEEYQLLLVLANKTLNSYSLEALDPNENQSPLLKRPKKIQGHSNFFKAGVCLGRHLVCSAKTSSLSTTIKVFEPMDTMSKGKKKPAITQLFQSSQDALKPFKVGRRRDDEVAVPVHHDLIETQEFYIPTESTSIHFLKSKLCVACARGFEVVSLETLETQSLLDQADTSLDFVAREKETKPIHIERLNGEFLLNYSDFSFFVNRNGWRARPDWRITWEGQPQSFALSYPYILAFEPSFIEIRHVETSACIHILTAKNIRMLHSSTREVCFEVTRQSVCLQLLMEYPRSSTPTKRTRERMWWRVWISGARRSSDWTGLDLINLHSPPITSWHCFSCLSLSLHPTNTSNNSGLSNRAASQGRLDGKIRKVYLLSQNVLCFRPPCACILYEHRRSSVGWLDISQSCSVWNRHSRVLRVFSWDDCFVRS